MNTAHSPKATAGTKNTWWQKLIIMYRLGFVIYWRELKSYFSTPIASIFAIIYLVLLGSATFYFGFFYERGLADLSVFFYYQPWLQVLLLPALSMKMWSEERSSHSIDLILTLPVPLWLWVAAKIKAATTIFLGVLLLTLPMWLTVNYLGEPDNGVIFTGYIASLMLAACLITLGAFISALTKSQVIAFVLSIVSGLFFLLTALPVVTDFFGSFSPAWFVDLLYQISLLGHFQDVSRGIIRLDDLAYYLIFVLSFTFATVVVIDLKKSF